jgi:hypothetical protein
VDHRDSWLPHGACLRQCSNTYDGTWSVTTQTRTGSCEPTAHYAITVVDRNISELANVSGTVSQSGNVRVSIEAAYANGQLEGSAGSGRWNAASGGVPCSGRWVASKQWSRSAPMILACTQA